MILSYVRTILLYLVLILCVRLMGKRQIGEMEPMEFVVTMLLANLAAIPMQDGAIPLYSGLVPILTVLGAELVLSGLILHSVGFRKLLCGKPVILIENGKLVQENLRRTRVTLDELTGHLREKDVLDITSVQYAILETDGNLSVFPYPKERPASAKDAGIHPKQQFLPVTVIEDGYFSRENLRASGKDESWLKQILKEHHAEIQDTLLLTVDAGGKVVWLGKEYEK
ncbi:MAG: DUF421 domain-containing protein [Firmicutes bacterium]|nr:DUF421 domain-containing protein [Bacillota bacterium]